MPDHLKTLSYLVVPVGATISLIALTRYLLSRHSGNKSRFPYPPGPKGLPFIGNVLDIPHGIPVWEGFSQMAETCRTDIVYLNMCGNDMIVLSSSEIIEDLSDKKSAIYSDKPQSTMVELMGMKKWLFPVFEYGERWRTYRRLFHEFFNVATADRYDEGQKKAASRLLKNLSEHPADFLHHTKLATGSLSLEIAYEIQVDSRDNPYFRAAEEAIEGMVTAMIPGAFPAEFFPFLRHFPSWLPGGGARSFGERVYKSSLDGITWPMQYVTERLKAGEGTGASVAAQCLGMLEELQEQGVNEEVIRDVAGVVYFAMTDTTNTVLSTFFLAMARNTHVVKKAQQQLDEVTGGGRLPEHSDIDELPYIAAIIKEIFRWAPPVPIGVPHRLMEDDLYNGMFIPAGATIVENIWGICHDEKVYPTPEMFNPDRFLDKEGKIDPSVKDPELRIFGSGRRICPGRHFALRNLLLVVANVLAAFDILPPADQNGNPQPPPPAFKHATARHPLPFKCIISPRSEKALSLVRDLHAHYWT